MIRKMHVLAGLILSMFCYSASATDKMYGIISGGFTDVEFDSTKVDGGSYKFGVGYQFSRQWYLELGYQQLANENLNSVVPTTLAQVETFEPGLQGDALFAAFLGKAAGRLGELYYRVGVLRADMKGQSLTTESSCELGDASGFTLSTGESYNLCQYDDSNIAAVLGIGFDFWVGINTMVRAEVEHIRGENDLAINAAYLGVRYNF